MKLCPKCQKQFSDDANFCPVDAARLAPLETPSVAADGMASKFELGDKLGGSRTGVVHRAIDKATGQAAAVKIISPTVVALPGLTQRLERELKQLERVQSAAVAKVLASGRRGDDTWVALELLEPTQTLAAAIAARGPMPPEQAARLIEIVGEALIEAAQVGVVHRDLAPKNILFVGNDVKLINFSLPVPSGERAPGVPEFVAPEQHDGRPVDQRSNLYSLGALYYFVLTGQSPKLDDRGLPPGGSAAEGRRGLIDDAGALVPPSALATVPPGLDGLILRALDRSPTKRFLTVRQFVDEVGRVSRGEAESQAPLMVPVHKKSQVVPTLLGVAPGEPVEPAGGGDRSPWAAPPTAQGIGVPAVAVPVAVASAPVPEVAAAAGDVVVAPVTAPVVAAPVITSQIAAAAGKKSSTDDEANRGKFRETLWFKKGELDAQAAEAAAETRARTGKDGGPDKTDLLPIDDRYRDDGSLSRTDKDKYSLRTGGTMTHKALREPTAGRAKASSDDALIGELKSGRNAILIVIAVGLVAIVVAAYLILR
jgi:hypothetical protein